MSLSSSILPAKCLTFISLSSQDSHLLLSRASYILLYEVRRSQFISQFEVLFPSTDIHGMTIYGCNNIIVYGHQYIQIIAIITSSNSNITITPYFSAPLKISGWILSATHISDNRIVLATLHNQCIIIHNNNNNNNNDNSNNNNNNNNNNDNNIVRMDSISCSIKCIIYSACFHSLTDHTLLLGCGTVFNQILLWKPLDTKQEPVRLIGHEGVIFRINFNSSGDMLCSVSDDRTIRIWRTRDYTPIITLYGHLSRIWDARFIPNTADSAIVSAGEDSTTRVWWLPSRKCVLTDDQAGSVCCLSVSSTGALCASASKDCSVCIIDLSVSVDGRTANDNNKIMMTSFQMPNSANKEKPTMVSVLGSYSYIVFTNRGRLVSISINECSLAPKFTELYRDVRFQSYSVMKLSEYKNALSIGSIYGDYCLFQIVTDFSCKLVCHKKLMNSKILAIAWYQVSADALYSLVSGLNGFMVLIKLSNFPNSTEIISNLLLPYSNHRWATCFVFSEPWLTCGDGKGSLHLYKVADGATNSQEGSTSDSYRHSLFKLGANVITSLSALSCDTMYVTARDGFIRVVNIKNDKLSVVDCWRPCKDCDWIESIHFADSGKIMMMLTFRANCLLLIDTSENRVLSQIPCGGGHRSWGCNHFQEIASGKLCVCYIKSSRLCIHQEEIVLSVPRPLKAFMAHVCNTAIVLRHHLKCNTTCIACGGEDGTLSIVRYSRHAPLDIVSSHQRHISNIVCMGVWEYSTDFIILYTAGGRGVMKAWLISTHALCCPASQPVYLTLLSEVSATPVLETNNKNLAKECDDFRVMALTVIPATSALEHDNCILLTGNSDGVLRVYSFTKLAGFRLLSVDFYHSRCVLAIRHLILRPSSLVVISGATDGILVIWNLKVANIKHTLPQDTNNITYPTITADNLHDSLLAYESSYVCHQSGINHFHIRQCEEVDALLVCSVGDDSSISILCLKYCTQETSEGVVTKFSIIWRLSEPFAHSSSIMSIYITSRYTHDTFRLLTVGRDQRAKDWSLERKKLFLRTDDVLTNVTSVSGFTPCEINDDIMLFIIGLGVEVIHV